LEDRVLFLGLKKNVEDYFSAMDLLVLPSVHEGLPVVIVEAQASGLACLVSDTVTKEVQLSELVNYLPITQGEAPWVDAIMNIKPTRKDVSKNIRNSGFCIKNSSDWLCDFYLDIAH
jgi:glycosyltransferase involved in cell wall biosynthesis